MANTVTYISRTKIRALLLLVLFTQTLLLREIHHAFTPHEAVLHCAAEDGAKHIHSPEYDTHACAICDFIFYKISFANNDGLYLRPLTPALTSSEVKYFVTNYVFYCFYCPSRGPPTA